MSFDEWKAENPGILEALGILDAPAKVLWYKGFLCGLAAGEEVSKLNSQEFSFYKVSLILK